MDLITRNDDSYWAESERLYDQQYDATEMCLHDSLFVALQRAEAADAEIKRLREAIEWACENAPAGENAYVAGIRRRAKEG